MVVASERAYSYRIGEVDTFRLTRKYRMWNTWEDVKDDVPVEHIADWVAVVADGAPDHYLRVVILTAHGQGGWIALGQGIARPRGPEKVVERARGIDIHDVPVFAKWKNRVANIWIIACSTAYTTPLPEYDGDRFCRALARTTGAYVVASTDSQVGELGFVLPWGCVDSWEGLVRRYEPEHGSIDWQHEYRSDFGAYTTLIGPYAVTPPIALAPRFRPGSAGKAVATPRPMGAPPQADPPWWMAPSRR